MLQEFSTEVIWVMMMPCSVAVRKLHLEGEATSP